MTNYKTTLRILDDFKYLHRLNRQEFWDLVFPNSLEHYFAPKWTLFQQDKFYDVSYDTGDKSVQCGRKVDAFQGCILI